MQDRDKEFTPAPEHTVPEMAAPLPPEVMPPETPLPGESADSAAALKKRAAKWKKAALMLVGLSAMTAAAVTGVTDGTGGTAGPAAPSEPAVPVQQEERYQLTGTLLYTYYNDTFDLSGGQPLVLAEGQVDASSLTETGVTPPQPEQPAYGGTYTFCGWAARYKTETGWVWAESDGRVTSSLASRIRPEGGQRDLRFHAMWRRTETGDHPWPLRLDDGTAVTEYDAAVPMGSGGNVFLWAYPQPARPGYRFAGWLDADGQQVDVLSAADFFPPDANGQQDWSRPVTVTLTAHWVEASA